MHSRNGSRLARAGMEHSLAARGQFLNNFKELGVSLAVLLLAAGGYLFAEQLGAPDQDETAGLLLAAFLIATAVTLLYCLLHPAGKSRQRARVWPNAVAWEHNTILIARGNNRSRGEAQVSGAWRTRYVDRARVRIGR